MAVMETNAPSDAISAPETAWVATLKNIWQWSRRTVKARKPRRLRVCETLSLGERRFLAVIEFDRQEFLVGGTGSSLELLARLQEGRVIPETSVPAGSRPF
jgi:flagellar biogenesis protein FliO